MQKNVPLAPYTTFKIGGPAKFFCVAEDQFDAHSAYDFAREKKLPIFILGGGSNLLVSDSGFDGIVLKIASTGLVVVSETKDSVNLEVAAGEPWDKIVAFSVKNGWWGLENLSHIPGSTGAIAVQNVGAYGQEASKLVVSVLAYDTQSHAIVKITNKDCGFGYRKSIFNSTEKGRYIIFQIELLLSKAPYPILSYRDLEARFKHTKPSLEDIRKAVTEIRDKKYPFPTEARNGNAGSFFKNPILNAESFETLRQKMGDIYGNEAVQALEKRKFMENGNIKIPAAFLLDLAGLKGMSFGGAKINPTQPLVILNESGKATAEDVLTLAGTVKKEIFNIFGLELKIEPELVGFSEKELKVLSVL